MTNESVPDTEVSFSDPPLCYVRTLAFGDAKHMTGARRRILVIEDDAETAEQIVDFLKSRGYQVDLATGGDEGLRLARSASYAVMTIDRMLPATIISSSRSPFPSCSPASRRWRDGAPR